MVEGQSQVDQTLVHNIGLGRKLYALTKTGISLKIASEKLGLTPDAVKRLLPLAFLSPRIVEQAVKGTLPPKAASKWFRTNPIPVAFDEQQDMLAALA